MKRASIVALSVCLASAGPAVSAQTTYTEHLTKPVAGAGRVTITQDSIVAGIVNNADGHGGLAGDARAAAARNSAEQAAHDRPSRRGSYAGERQRHYEQGYRIQIFTGGNSRNDKAAAIQAGNRCKSLFGELSVYPHFFSPRWICQVGDFRNINDARKYLELIRNARISNEARIVRCKVLVAY